MLFSGDCVFVAGCGRLFEGNAAEMLASFEKIGTSVPANTLLFPGHEYALVNATFSLGLDSDNAAVQALLKRAWACKRAGQPCLGSTIGDELQYNPFFRCRYSPYNQV